MIALRDSGLRAQAHPPLTVEYRGQMVGEFYPDVLVEGKIIVELKAVKALAPEHEAQVLNYLKASGIRVGLLVNLGSPRLEWKRFVL